MIIRDPTPQEAADIVAISRYLDGLTLGRTDTFAHSKTHPLRPPTMPL